MIITEFGFDAEADDASSSTTTESRRPSTAARRGASTVSGDSSGKPKAGALIGREEREYGLIGIGLYWRMMREASLSLGSLTLLLVVLATAAKVVGDWWLARWTGRDQTIVSDTLPQLTDDTYLKVYAGIASSEIVFASLVGVVMVVRVGSLCFPLHPQFSL